MALGFVVYGFMGFGFGDSPRCSQVVRPFGNLEASHLQLAADFCSFEDQMILILEAGRMAAGQHRDLSGTILGLYRGRKPGEMGASEVPLTKETGCVLRFSHLMCLRSAIR